MIIGTMISSRVLKYFATLLLLFTSVIHVSSDDNLCEELPIITNGQLRLADGQSLPFSVNDAISYRCNEDFKTDEMFPKVTCVLKDNVANWTESACKPIIISCHDPGYIPNADRTGYTFTYPHSIKYTCHEGFRLIGVDTRYCSKTGQWQPHRMPYCEEILCPALGHPANGEVLHSNRRFDSVAVYKCDRYYKLVGDSERECQADGTWSGDSPVCEKITCMAPGKFPNGRIIGKNVAVYNASDILIFRCNDGLTHATSKCLENGEWNHPPPVCPGTPVVEATTSAPTTLPENIPDKDKNEGNSCEDPGKIKYGDRAFIGLHINSTVTYICDEGYELRGKSTLLCLETGKWDLDKLPICVKPISVLTILGIVAGVITLISLSVGGYLWYRYRMKGTRGYGEKSKALTADAADTDEIAGLDRDKKQIPVTVL